MGFLEGGGDEGALVALRLVVVAAVAVVDVETETVGFFDDGGGDAALRELERDERDTAGGMAVELRGLGAE